MTAHAACQKTAPATEGEKAADDTGADAQTQTRQKQESVAAAHREASLRLRGRRVVGRGREEEEGGRIVLTRAGHGQA